MQSERTHSVAVALLLAMMVASLLPMPRASADPTIIDNPDGTSDAVWTFATPTDYTRTNVSISGGVVALRQQTTWWNSTTAADFLGPDSATNIELTTWPGNVALASTSGAPTVATLQPGPAAGIDAYINKASATTNYGTNPNLVIDGRTPSLRRALLRFDLLTIPTDSVIDGATLSLYMSTGVAVTVTTTIHAVTGSWDESQVTWNDRLAGTPWTAPGGDGDYNTFVVARMTLDGTVGWKTANITQLVDLGHRNLITNLGLILVAPGSGGTATDKTFYSSDYAIDPTFRPKLEIRYRALNVTGEYISKVGDAGALANWGTISWNATRRSLASDEFDGTSLDPKWTWTNPPASYDVGTSTPGSLRIVTATGVDFTGTTFTGHFLWNEIVGDFIADMKSSSDPTASGQKAGLMVLVNTRNWYAVQKANAAGTVEWQVRSTVDGATTTDFSGTSGNPIPAWVRIQRTGNTFAASTSSDGTTWTPRFSYVPAFEYPLQIRLGILAADGGSGTAQTVDVDYVRVTLGPDATVAVQTRIGDTNPVDGMWSPWSATYPTPSGSAMSGSSRYVQFRLALSVAHPEHTPNVGDVNISWTNYVTSGTIETNDLLPGDVAEWGNFTAVQALNGQTITYAYSTDSGGNWTPVTPPASLQNVSVASGKIRFRATFSTTNTLVTPTLSELHLTYRHRLDHFYVTASASATAGGLFSVTVTAKDAANITLTGWAGTVALAARLPDGITPGGGVLGTTNLAITSGGTAILATETYTKAETIRIRASYGIAEGLSGGIAVSPGAVDRIEVTPASITLLFLEPQAFGAQGFDAWNNSIPGLSFTWSVTGGIGTLNTTTGASVTLTTGTAEANGTVEASSGAVVGVASISVVTGTRPWIAISAPANDAHVTGTVSIVYTNSTDAVSARFEYDPGAGWVLIGTTATLNGTYSWNTAGLDFASGSLRATVANNRTVTNTTVVVPLEVDNTPPTIDLGTVTDNQATSGTLTLTYTTAADVVRLNFTYFDGAWKVIGPDPTIDGSYVWTPPGPINGATIRGVATDEVGLTGAAQRQGVGNRTVGANPPSIQGIPEIRVRTGSAYTLNLTFYVTDADTALAALSVTVSDPANVTAVSGAYPSLAITYPASGTYDVTLWISDGTDTAWVILRIVAAAGNPPALSAPLPTVVFDEDTTARNALGSPLTAFFTDADGEPLAFTIFRAVQVSYVVNGNATLDLGAAANWFGSETLRARATDPTGSFAEAAFRVVVLPLNDPPTLAPIPALSYDAGVTFLVDLQPYVSDVDNVLTTLTVTTDSAHVSVSGFLLTLAFPAEWDRANFTITVSDGAAAATQAVSVTFIPPWWRSPYLLAIPPAGILVVVAMFAQRARWRPTKAFLVDERGQMLREFTLDPSCTVTYDDVVKAGALDAIEKPIKVAKYHAQTVVGDALAVVLLAYGPVNLDQVEFARELLVNIQDKFEGQVKERLEEARVYETELEAARKSLEDSRGAFEAQSRAFAGMMDAITTAQSKMAAESRSIREKVLDLEKREAHVREDRTAIDGLARELEELRTNVEGRLTEVAQREGDADSRAKAIRDREQRIGPLETALGKRENGVAAKERELEAKEQDLTAATHDVEARRKALEAAEEKAHKERLLLDGRAKELESLQITLERRTTEVQGRETEATRRLTEVKTREDRVAPIEASLGTRVTALADREGKVKVREDAVAEQEAQVRDRSNTVFGEETRIQKERQDFEARAKEMAALEESLTARTEDTRTVEAAVAKRAEELRAREERVAPIEAGFVTREKALADREAKLPAWDAAVAAREQEADRRLAAAEDAEKRLDVDRQGFEVRVQELEGQEAIVRARFAESKERQSEIERQEAEIGERAARIISKESNVAEREESLAPWETRLQEESKGLAEREKSLADGLKKLGVDEATLVQERTDLQRLREASDARVKDLDARSSTFEAEMRHRTAEIDARMKALVEAEQHLTEEQSSFEATRSEKTQWIASKSIEIEAREQSLHEKEAAVKEQAKENARTLADLSAREEALEIGTDKLEKAHAELDARKAELDRLSKSLEAKATQLREEEGRNAEEYRTWHATSESEQAFLRQQKETFERETAEQRETWAERMLRIQTKEQELAEREEKVRNDVGWIARNEAELNKRELAAADAMKEAQAARAQVEAQRKDLEARALELETRERSVREEAARHAEDLTRRARALQEDTKALADERARFEKEAAAHAQKIQESEAEMAQRVQTLEKRAGSLIAHEARLATLSDSLKEQEERLNRERIDLQTMAEQLAAKQEEVAQLKLRAEDEAERLRQGWESFRQASAEKEAELVSERERISRDSNALQEKLGAKAQELAARERSLAARETELRAEEADLEAHLRELETRERQAAAHATELEAQSTALAKQQMEIEDRTVYYEAASKKLAMEAAEKRREWEILQQTLKSHEAQMQADAEHRLEEVQRRLVELERREQALTRTMAQLDAERAKLADAAKAQAAKDAEAASAWSRAEKHLAEVKAAEDDLLGTRQAFESERAAWNARRSEELRQLEMTRDAAGEQAAQTERLVQESQRRANLAAEAEKAAKRQADELRALQAQLEARRAEAEAAQRTLQEQTARLEEASRKLATREMETNAKLKEVREQEARVTAAAQQATVAAEETRARQAQLEKEADRVAKLKTDLEARQMDMDSRHAELQGKLAEVTEREHVLTTELQRAENLMEDLGRKEGEVKAKERSFAALEAELASRQASLARKDGELQVGMAALERMRQDLEAKIAMTEEDRNAASAGRAEAEAMKTEAEQAKTQAEAMQREVSKNMKFLQKKAVDVLDREEKLRERETRSEESEKTLDARAEILDGKERSLEVERDEIAAKGQRLEAEVARLRAQLAEAQGAARTSEDAEERRRDMEARVKIIQKKAFDLLDREEKIRKHEEELRARAQELGVEL